LNQKNAPPATKPENKPRRHIDCGRILYTAFLCMCMAAMLCLPASATTIWEKASEVMKDVYSQVLAISTIAAVVTAAVALLLMNFSRSGRTVDESRAWLKRIIITWIILNSLGFIMSYVTPFFSGGQYTP
jgi:ABC-type Fe3+ transport system permease subunit